MTKHCIGCAALFALVTLVAGCSSTGSDAAKAQAGPQKSEVTLPAGLLTALPEVPRRMSFAPQELTQQGWEADLTLPFNNAGTTHPHLYLFSGNEVGGQIDFAECAYAMYRFQVPALEEQLKVHSFFDDETPPAEGTVFVGMANWWEGRWDWFPWSEVVEIPELSAHKRLEDGMITVAFLQTSGEILKLSVVSVGERFHLRARFFIDGTGYDIVKDTQVNFTAEASFIGTIDNIEWDFDGDGTYEMQGLNLGEPVGHTFDTVGEFDCTLRISGTPLDGGPAESDTEVAHFSVSD